jgi:5-formyltetrahydrofolate cyclo-ligase
MSSKQTLREQFILKRKLIYTPENQEIIDQLVLDKFKDYITQHKPKSLGLYKNFGSEMSTSLLDKYARDMGIKICYPKTINSELFFLQNYSENDFIKSENGFLEPINSEEFIIPELVITPALAIDKNLNRLGYGKGFYDRFINKNHTPHYLTIIPDQLLVEKLPTDPWDEPIDEIIEVIVPKNII